MESTQAPTPTALAVGAIALIWTEVVRRKVSIWVGIKDSMEVMETRRVMKSAQGVNAGLPKGKPAPKPEPTPSEPQNVYERMRGASGVRFEPSDPAW